MPASRLLHHAAADLNIGLDNSTQANTDHILVDFPTGFHPQPYTPDPSSAGSDTPPVSVSVRSRPAPGVNIPLPRILLLPPQTRPP
ncbi:hypothetical protein VDGL01_08439 [Verticillium dahliae]